MQLRYECRIEKKLTMQTIRVVTDKLPAYVHVIQCNSCGALSMAKVDPETAYVE
jgi:NMD protein affecting ribosome stability and mRNA decay